MRKHCELAVYTLAIALSCCGAYGSTITFDEVPPGTSLLSSYFYLSNYRVDFSAPFEAADHTSSTWGPPHSGTNVLAWESSGEFVSHCGLINFGSFAPGAGMWDEVRSVGAYFSTDLGAMVRMTARTYGAEVASVVIGAAGESWDNRYVEIGFPGSSFCLLIFDSVNSDQDLMSFCMDDMTVTYVPEPSSLLALSAGLVSAGAILGRRRRR